MCVHVVDVHRASGAAAGARVLKVRERVGVRDEGEVGDEGECEGDDGRVGEGEGG